MDGQSRKVLSNKGLSPKGFSCKKSSANGDYTVAQKTVRKKDYCVFYAKSYIFANNL
jgi:hypothetical protein